MSFDLSAVRAEFPALEATDNGRPRYYFDNPAGTQVPRSVVERMSQCLIEANANIGGNFVTSERAGDMVEAARLAMADFLNAASPSEVIFGQNMTTLTFHLSRSLGRKFKPGDEIILSRMDHDANVQPWVLLARDLDLRLRWLEFDTESYEFDLAQLDELLNKRTRLVCVGAASNLLGTLNDVTEISRRARAAGAWTFIDAVQSAPHVVTDVQAIGCDFLVCSAYKFFGPHQGILWGRQDVLSTLEAYKLRPAPEELPWCFETGTQSHEGIAGCGAAVDYFARIGATMAAEHLREHASAPGRRQYVQAALDCLFEYERALSQRLVDGLQAINGIKVQGITDPGAMDRRVPTVSITHQKAQPSLVAKRLAEQNIFVWSGHNYAVEPARALGLYDCGGVVRIGPVHYNSAAEIDVVLQAVEDAVSA